MVAEICAFPTFTDPILREGGKVLRTSLLIRYFRGTGDIQRWGHQIKKKVEIIEPEKLSSALILQARFKRRL